MEGAAQVPCARCGTFVDPNAANYSSDGELVCTPCEERYLIREGEERAGKSIVGMGFGVLGLGILSFCFNPLLLASIGSVASAIGVFTTMYRHPEFREKMGWTMVPTIGVTIVGVLLGLNPLWRLMLAVLLSAS